ncbi:branched-chain amino acid ABC transporter permease [Leifsonia sp. H3M29-4]|uniref:branched-chain amino acid ABC transporter permease n=1 Tax=Salinibacterium metalliresistens TaxID=3031321 RepID=UPI0023DBE282|nr:branched-chain amino acid ABC transporter permease [Salinibacterium metalliresistens]MDF1478362.1 branched-chain amino acid ABC transporter permease [Salinibacterium metalliresistens]
MITFAGGAAVADEVDTDKYPYRVSGNVQLDGEPLEGVELTVSGNGIDSDVTTDANGQWAVGVPERNATYTVTLNELTLPEGIAVVDETDDTPNVKDAEVGPGGRATVNFFIGEGERNVTSFADQLIQRTITGLRFGLMLALAAVGLSLVYGTTGLSNFAHGEMVTLGAVLTFALSRLAGWPIYVAIPVAIVLCAVFGFLLDAGIWRPLRRRRVGVVQLMIVSIGLALAIRYIFQFFIGGGTSQLPGADAQPIPLFGVVSLSVIDMVSTGISIVVIVAFALWLLFTRIGKATRAISDNPSLASASGIDVDHVVRIVWILAGGLAGLAGVLYAYYRPGLKWDMGTGFLLLLFAAVTLGGLGTAFGALAGSIVIGLIVEVSTLWIPSDLKFAAPLVVLIIILLFRPQGILGRRERIG